MGAAAAIAVAATSWRVASSFADAPTFAVIGDHAADLTAQLGTTEKEGADITVVLVNGWGNLRHLPDMQTVCGKACRDKSRAQVRIVQLRPSKSTKVLLFNLRAANVTFESIAKDVLSEKNSLVSAGKATCQSDETRAVFYDLPFGLGRVPPAFLCS